MMKKLCLVFISVLQLCSVPAGAQTNDKAREMAVKIADERSYQYRLNGIG